MQNASDDNRKFELSRKRKHCAGVNHVYSQVLPEKCETTFFMTTKCQKSTSKMSKGGRWCRDREASPESAHLLDFVELHSEFQLIV